MSETPSLKQYSNILVEKDENVGIVRLNRPSALNALSTPLMKELLAALEGFEDDEGVHCIIITGSDRVFSAGADIKGMAEQSSVQALKEGNLENFDQLQKTTKPIVAAISGFALGGGLELAMACDVIICGEGAKLGQPEINIGVIPGAGGTQRLTRVVGKYRAMDMILTGSQITAKEAFERGLVSRIVPNEMYFTEALKVAKEIASKGPLATKIAKECVQRAYESTLTEGLEFEHRNFYLLMSTEDKKEGMKAFIEKRKPVFKGQ